MLPKLRMSQRSTLALRGCFPAQTENIQCSVHVSVNREPAIRTSMYTNRQVFRHNLLATAASLRGLVGIDREDCDPGLDSLVVQYLAEDAQGNVMCCAGQVAISQHKAQRQLFQHHYAVGGDQPKDNLVPPVAALVGDMLMFFGKLVNS